MSTTLYDNRITGNSRNKALNVCLWIAQCPLAVFFLLAGGMHAFMPIDQAAKVEAGWRRQTLSRSKRNNDRDDAAGLRTLCIMRTGTETNFSKGLWR